MDSDIVDKVSQVLNPVSQKTLGEEGRIISVEKKVKTYIYVTSETEFLLSKSKC